jgi:hypothetical protein
LPNIACDRISETFCCCSTLEFFNRIGQFLPRHPTKRAAALPHKAAAPTARHRGSYGPIVLKKYALADFGKIRGNLHVAGDGVEAMSFLRRDGAYADAPRPHVILLDLNLPKMDGREVLTVIKNDIDLKAIRQLWQALFESSGGATRSGFSHAPP